MKLTIAVALATIVTVSGLAQTAPPPASLAQRIGHTDPAQMRRSRSHGSEGDMACMTLVPLGNVPLG